MVTVTLRETYDLSTKPSKMTLIGVHTPTKNIIQRLYPGFCEQYKMCKILHQNVRLASAARLPVDPLGIGVNEEGTISPEDMFNPILYKACSNQSLSNLEYRIRGLKHGSYLAQQGLSIKGESVDASNENVTLIDDEFNVYYSILSNTRGWKVAHPQRGLSMNKLRPLVYERWYNEGVNRASGLDDDGNLGNGTIPIDESYVESTPPTTTPVNELGSMDLSSMRGRPHRMPAFNTKYLTFVDDSNAVVGTGSYTANGMLYGAPENCQNQMPEIPCIYTGIILVPPSKTTILYYRMVVETVISFFGVQSMDEIACFDAMNSRTVFPVYWNDYRTTAKDSALKVEENTVSTSDGASLRKIMES